MTTQDDERAQTLAEVEAIAMMAASIMAQAVAQGVPPEHAGAAVLGAGAKALRVAIGPDAAAQVVRTMANEVEADRGRLDA